MEEKDFYSIPELARLLGISRIALYRKVVTGKIKARRIGRNFAIPKSIVSGILGKTLTKNDKQEIDKAVEKTVKEYGETLKLLGRSD